MGAAPTSRLLEPPPFPSPPPVARGHSGFSGSPTLVSSSPPSHRVWGLPGEAGLAEPLPPTEHPSPGPLTGANCQFRHWGNVAGDLRAAGNSRGEWAAQGPCCLGTQAGQPRPSRAAGLPGGCHPGSLAGSPQAPQGHPQAAGGSSRSAGATACCAFVCWERKGIRRSAEASAQRVLGRRVRCEPARDGTRLGWAPGAHLGKASLCSFVPKRCKEERNSTTTLNHHGLHEKPSVTFCHEESLDIKCHHDPSVPSHLVNTRMPLNVPSLSFSICHMRIILTYIAGK